MALLLKWMRKLAFPCCHLAPPLSWWLQQSTTNKLPDETAKTSTAVLFLSNFLSNFSVRCFCLRKSSWTNSVMISNEPSPLPSYCTGTLVRGMSCLPDWKLKGWVTVGHLNGCPWRNTCWWNACVVKCNMWLFNGLERRMVPSKLHGGSLLRVQAITFAWMHPYMSEPGVKGGQENASMNGS